MFENTTKVLIVDDMLTMRKIVQKAFRDLGFTDLAEASDGVKAWEAVSGSPQPFGLIISDWNMPNATGLDLLKRVRSDSRFKNTPFVLLTAESEAAQVAEAVKAGVDHYIVKPFTADILKKRLEEVYQKVKGR